MKTTPCRPPLALPSGPQAAAHERGAREGGLLRGADDGYFDGLKSAQLTPALWLDRLRDADAGNRFTLAQAGCLKLQMRAASGSWLDAFR